MAMGEFKSAVVASVGECMVELARGGDGRFTLSYGGDTFNTAVYLARAGVEVGYVSRVGDDPYSAGILALAQAEGVSTAAISVAAGRMPGLYLIETTAEGERSFWYWRDRSPAREVFESEAAGGAVAALETAGLIYFSGITLSLYSPAGLDRFAEALVRAKAAGARVAMDNNFRPRGWGGDLARARATFALFWALADVALPTFDDEQALWGDASPGATAARLAGLGVGEIVVKNGLAGALVRAGGERHVPCPDSVVPLDTTAAGDSFNAGYLAARLAGRSADQAALAGHRLAAVVIRHRGAIVPKEATAPLFR